ncbi:MAG: ACT domain-containing protein [Lachnospiraceae bacterium]|nr:ACT domain-containing protein [Lachnospiraceae bacterium]
MAVKQLSVLAENRKGSLKRVLDVLSEANVDLRSIMIADTEEYGIFRMITSDTEKAAKVLRNAGFTASYREVIATAIPDKPGALNKVLALFDEAEINLEYMYSVINSNAGSAYMVFRVDRNEEAERVLTANGIEILTEDKLRG